MGAMRRVGMVSVGLACALLAGCAQRIPLPSLPFRPKAPESNLPIMNEEAFAEKPMRAYRIPTPQPGKIPEQTVIGEMSTYRVRANETLLDVARYDQLGTKEVDDDKPGRE